MVETSSVERTGPSVGPAAVGVVAALAGAGFVLLYPLSVAGVLPGTEGTGSVVPRTTHPILVYLSVIVGPILLTWGSFVYLDDEYAPFTPRRALGALVPALVSASMGISWFVYEWMGETMTGLEGEVSPPLPFGELLRLELTAIQFVALAAVSAMFVGTVVATRDRRTALATTAVPLGLVAAGLLWGPQQLTFFTILFVAVITAVPCAVGYAAARSDSGHHTA